jgi:hypothetical protein
MVEISEKQQLMAKLKSQGKTNREIAKIAYPQTEMHNAEVIVSRQLKKPNVVKYIDTGREAALRRYGITWNRVISKLNYFLDSENESMQMQALRTILSMLPASSEPTKKEDNKELIAAINSKVDDVELQRIVFKKSEPIKKNQL